jgi:putative membrane protein
MASGSHELRASGTGGNDAQPPGTTGTGTEPDYRFSLANERTYLAWLRTSLALVAAGVAVVELVHTLGPRPQRMLLGLTLVGLALLIAGTSHRRWQQVERAMRLGEPLPRSRMPAILAVGLCLVIGGTVIMLLRP